jgi:tetratricopeptide (TPR) repeat protein
MGKKRRGAKRVPVDLALTGTPRPADAASSLSLPAIRPASSPARRRAFRATALVVVPLLVLLVAEGVLRLAGYGYPTGFFLRLDDGRTLAPNLRFGRQFGPREMATQPYPFLMPAQKPAGTVRLFILGESAAQGTPAPAFGFGRILETMLRQKFPGRRFEVVNAAMRGINSHVVLPIARECARREPDLFLVYLGNNEAVGLHSPEREGINLTPYLRLLRAGQWIQGTKLAQLAAGFWSAVRTGDGKRPEQDMAFFRAHALAADHPRRAAVYDNFRANLEDICRVARASGAKVILSTVAVNLMEFPPLASAHRAELTGAAKVQWESAYAHGTNAEVHRQFTEAIGHYEDAARFDDHYAELHFRLARCALAAGQTNVAQEHFALARDWDALPFRADSHINRIIRGTAQASRDPGVLLLDAERFFAERASQGVSDNHWFHDHVHFTFDGDHLLAQAFLPLIAQVLSLTNSIGSLEAPATLANPRQACARALAFTEWDEISVTAAMLRQTAKAPFLDQLEHADRQARAERALTRRGEIFHEQHGKQRAVEVYRAATAQSPNDWQLHYNFGALLDDFGDKRGALPEFETAVRLMPVFPALRLLLVQALWDQNRRAEAIEQCRLALRIDPDYAPAKDALAQAIRARR